MNKSVLAAIKELYSLIETEENIINDIEHDYLTENTARNGREVLWYDDGRISKAIYIDTLEELTECDIYNELC